MTITQKWPLWLLVGAGLVWLMHALAPVLAPFLMGAVFAYLGDPLVDRLENWGLSRTLAVVVVFTGMVLILLLLVLIILPLIQQQLGILFQQIPFVFDWLQHYVLSDLLQVPETKQAELNLSVFKDAIFKKLPEVMDIFKRVSASGIVVIEWLVYFFLSPVVTFYLLRDWDILVAQIRTLIPRRYEPTVARLAKECDTMLAQFLRGQLLLMLVQGIIYIVGLSLVGLNLAFLIGVLAGFVSFIPYMGFAFGFTMAGVAAFAQFQDVTHVLYALVVFWLGHLLESAVLSPKLVGERMGLHPVAVIFALLAGGQLFGFFGVLLALPLAAIAVVLLRHWYELYLKSELYMP